MLTRTISFILGREGWYTVLRASHARIHLQIHFFAHSRKAHRVLCHTFISNNPPENISHHYEMSSHNLSLISPISPISPALFPVFVDGSDLLRMQSRVQRGASQRPNHCAHGWLRRETTHRVHRHVHHIRPCPQRRTQTHTDT